MKGTVDDSGFELTAVKSCIEMPSTSRQTEPLISHTSRNEENHIANSHHHHHHLTRHYSVTDYSSDDDASDMQQIFSKSCDYNDDEAEFHNCVATVSRSFSEDVLLKPSSRRISVVSMKGRLIGCQIKPGEKIIRSLSVGQQIPRFKDISNGTATILHEKKKPKFTRKQKLVAFCLCLVDFTSYLSMSIIAPFFPSEATHKGMREAVSGFVFSIYALVVMLTSPIFGKLIPHVGAKYMFFCGISFTGVCNILFGLLDLVNGTTEFTVLCLVIRSFEALGAAAYTTASCTILIEQFPDDIGTVFGFTETCLGIGMSIGPAIGGALYSAGGFGVPFYTLGVFVVMTVPVCWYLMRDIEDPGVCLSSRASYKKLLSMPHVIVVCLILVVGSQSQGFIDPTLAPHMRQYNLSAGVIGLLFLVLSGSYALSSPIVGWISGKFANKYPVMVVGLSFVTLSLLLLGPSKILPIPGSVWLSVVALIMLGVSFAAAYVPTFESLFIAAMNGGLEDDIYTYSVVSGLWNSVYSLGEVTGPSLGGVLSDFFTFPDASSLMALCTAVAFVVAVIAWINPGSCFGPIGLVDLDDSDSSASEGSVRSVGSVQERNCLTSANSPSYGSLWPNEKIPVV